MLQGAWTSVAWNLSSLSVNYTKDSFNMVQRLKVKVTQTIFKKVKKVHLLRFQILLNPLPVNITKEMWPLSCNLMPWFYHTSHKCSGPALWNEFMRLAFRGHYTRQSSKCSKDYTLAVRCEAWSVQEGRSVPTLAVAGPLLGLSPPAFPLWPRKQPGSHVKPTRWWENGLLFSGQSTQPALKIVTVNMALRHDHLS